MDNDNTSNRNEDSSTYGSEPKVIYENELDMKLLKHLGL